MSRLGRWLRVGAAIAAGAGGAYGAYAAAAWYRYGRPAGASGGEAEVLLDALMPEYEVRDRHRLRVAAPAAEALRAARGLDLGRNAMAGALFDARARLLGAVDGPPPVAGGIVDALLGFGWCVLAQRSDREIVLGTVTRPWEREVVFRSVPAARFRTFSEPGAVKIVFNLRADPLGPDASMLSTETRVATTDAAARRRFRRYWAVFSAGIVLLRLVLLRAAKQVAEHAPGG